MNPLIAAALLVLSSYAGDPECHEFASAAKEPAIQRDTRPIPDADQSSCTVAPPALGPVKPPSTLPAVSRAVLRERGLLETSSLQEEGSKVGGALVGGILGAVLGAAAMEGLRSGFDGGESFIVYGAIGGAVAGAILGSLTGGS